MCGVISVCIFTVPLWMTVIFSKKFLVFVTVNYKQQHHLKKYLGASDVV